MDQTSARMEPKDSFFNGNVFWLFYTAIPFVLSQCVRIATVVVLKLYDKIPLRDAVFPLIQFMFQESRRLLGFSDAIAKVS